MKRNKNKVKAPDNETLQQFLTRNNVNKWDFVIVGDGSGSNWQRKVGWGSVLIERATMKRFTWCGAMNRGTVNLAEMLAYLQPLEWLVSREIKNREKSNAPMRTFSVHIFTDSDYCRSVGSKRWPKKKNNGFWAAFDAFARHGFILNWHWIRRESCALNQFCDKLSRMSRTTMEEHSPRTRLRSRGDARSVYDINPDEEG